MKAFGLFIGVFAVARALAHPGGKTIGDQQQHKVQSASGYWYANIAHDGISPTIKNGKNWTVFRNVMDYGAKGDGISDDAAAIQKAIDTGDSSGTRAAKQTKDKTGQPAVVYFPPGTYAVKSTISNRVGTILMGDPTNRPIIMVVFGFLCSFFVVGHDTCFSGL